MSARITRQDEESYDLAFEPRIHLGNGTVAHVPNPEVNLELINPDAPLTFVKYREAEYFLQLLGSRRDHQAAFQYHLNAFLAALFAIEEIMKRELQRNRAFRHWWQVKGPELQAEPSFKILRKLRNDAVHSGTQAPAMALVYEFREDLEGRTTVSWFVEAQGLEGARHPDPITICHEAFQLVKRLLTQAESRGFFKGLGSRNQHSFVLRGRKETAPGVWRPANLSEFPAFSRLKDLDGELRIHGLDPPRK